MGVRFGQPRNPSSPFGVGGLQCRTSTVFGADTLPWEGDGPMRTLTWMALGFSGALLLGAAAHPAGAQVMATVEPVLEIMSPDRGDCTLRLSWPWGAMAVNHVLFDDHHGPFKAVVESAGKGVRVR